MPFADPGLALACAALLHGEPTCDIATLVAPELDPSDRSNPDVVKAVLALADGERHARALYFTRSTLYGDGPVWRHIGIYGYRREALERFCAAPPSPLEKREKLEQLRAGARPLHLGRGGRCRLPCPSTIPPIWRRRGLC
jgi:3-deoxy-manno-octulosonate cytidylyltransferase (CMP-KDO synthetase)